MPSNIVGIYNAKTKFSQLIDRVQTGEVIGLTRHGKLVALLTPVPQRRPNPTQVIARLRKLGSGSRLNGLIIKELRDEGRP